MHDGDFAIQTIQDVQPILDHNKQCQSFGDPASTETFRRVASIPLVFIEKWRNELGVDFYNPDHQDKVIALLNDPEYRWLRTDGSQL
jgi:hypothetical protein